MAFKLLSYFVANVGRIIAREELVAEVWQQTFVDDNAINRAISELRKQLSHPDHKAPLIKTHYRKGYSLTVPITVIEPKDEHPEKVSTLLASQSGHEIVVEKKNNNQYKWLLISVLLLLIANFVYSYININQTKALLNQQLNANSQSVAGTNIDLLNEDIVDTKVTTVTWNSGSENRVVVSPNKQYFTFSNYSQGLNSSFVKRNGDQKEVQLTYKDFNVLALSWQPKSNQLLAEVTNYKDECFYGLFDISDFENIPPVKVIKRCQKETYSSAQLSLDGNALYYITLDKESSGGEIRLFNITTQRDSLVVLSGGAQYGVSSFKMSPNGQALIYSWAKRSEPTQLYLYTLANRESRLLYTYETLSFSVPYAWLADSAHFTVLYGDKLRTVNINTQESNMIKLDLKRKVKDISMEHSQQMLAQQQGGVNYQLAKFSGLFTSSQSHEKLFPSDSWQYTPVSDVAAPNTFYFLSKQTGIAQVWQAKQGQLTQITHYSQSANGTFSELMQSPNGQFLLFYRTDHFELVDINTGELQRITQQGTQEATSYQWGKNEDSFYYSTENNGISQIWQFDLATQTNKLLNLAGKNY